MAIITYCIHRKKLEDGNFVTKYILIILISAFNKGAIINLSLGVEEGTQIRRNYIFRMQYIFVAMQTILTHLQISSKTIQISALFYNFLPFLLIAFNSAIFVSFAISYKIGNTTIFKFYQLPFPIHPLYTNFIIIRKIVVLLLKRFRFKKLNSIRQVISSNKETYH